MRALAVILFLGVSPAHADDTFDAKATTAERITHIDDVVWALTAACNEGSDPQQRQCRRLRDTRAAQLANATLLVEAERDAFSIGAWDAAKKSVPITLSGCIHCGGVEVDGKTWYVVASRGGSSMLRMEGGAVKANQLYDNARAFPDDASAKKYAAAIAAAKVQLLVRVPAKPTWNVDGKRGVALDVIGYRVVSACDGSVVVANPASAGGEVDKKACAAGRVVVDSLSPSDVKESMKPVLDSAKSCYAKYKMSGKGKLKITIAADGSIAEYEQHGDFAGSPTGECIDSAVKAVAFPPSKKPKTTISMPVALP